MNPKIDNYLAEGCGRCALVGTPDCKVHSWHQELITLRSIVLSCGLTEELKWSMPCYTYNNKNVAMVVAFKNNCTISFFKGALIPDPAGILEKAGENTQSTRLIKITQLKQVIELEETIKSYIYAAIEVEKKGLKINRGESTEIPIPDEFIVHLKANALLKKAFESLTPGRQRGYLLHFSSAKQPKTRYSRIQKCIPTIMAGRGLQD
ncbi:YdeI/OmpD-associated family protein [Fulvivirga sediminis]|uniref:DUF1801 domain-containing protein n=1 Tax=Fulvivirga sediminis TaxID=2803949 RepID=A0A937FB69_9BACT|nr:DUF1801 domain-containing protein [Fulvivirga sediminis]MBL3657660.1 DUF1801 domain-containing protein [Fulvivirga sediminis]